jgi:polysaccharide biosynthesis protein PslG
MLDSLPRTGATDVARQTGATGATGATGTTGTTGATAPAGPPNQVAVGVNVAATSGNVLGSAGVIAAIDQSVPAWVRVFVGWDAIEPQQGVYDTAALATYQQFFQALPAGTKIDVDVEGTPAWAAGGSAAVNTPPANDADYAAFLTYLAGAFGGRVTAWEIWNEEDAASWWNGTPAQYAALLQASYAAIRAADPQATVVVGGLTGNDAAYLAQLYAAGAGGAFDAVGVHTDTACNVTPPGVYAFDPGTQTINRYYFLGFTAVHATMAANGDGAKPIYMTELGWSTTAAVCPTGAWAGQKPGGVDQATQAAYLQQAYHCLAQPQFPYVKVAIWFELVDNGVSTNPVDNFGLLANDLSPKPAFAAFAAEAAQGDQLTGPCG